MRFVCSPLAELVARFVAFALAVAGLAGCHAPRPEGAAALSAAERPSYWTDWRGPARDGWSDCVPERLAGTARVVWRHALTGQGLSGVAATGSQVVVADKSKDGTRDVWRCLDAATGNETWTVEYEAAGSMAYSNAPRATPVLRDGLVYLLGAFGHLTCAELATGNVVWRRHLADEFGAQAPMWGYTSTPLLEGDRLIVNPGAPDASLVALDSRTGAVLWKCPGDTAAYASFVAATLGGVRQIVGYDSASLGGWDAATGRRLWRLVPSAAGDYNVPTPVVVGGRLLAASENNGTRLYGFARGGRIRPRPLALNGDLKPDMSTPVVAGRYVVGFGYGLYCLDLEDGLRTLWKSPGGALAEAAAGEERSLGDYAALIAGPGRVLALGSQGQLLLWRLEGARRGSADRLDLLGDPPASIWSHPALVGHLLYVRGRGEVACFDIAAD